MPSISAPVTAVCTIVSKNYFAHARSLHQSLMRHNPEVKFFVLLVDRNEGHIDLSKEPFEVIEAAAIGIPHFERLAFKFDILELNTNVKPSFMRFLFDKRGVSQLVYLDPDIIVYDSLQVVFRFLEGNEIILTPHCISPITDHKRPSEQDFLANGVFNLGFIGVRNSAEVYRFLAWWEERCLTLGFNEPRTGLFVDQKWINLAPCLFEGVHVLKHLGCNMAYWNLHERALTKEQGRWVVNDSQPLIFFHFSGVSIDDSDQISRHQNRYDLNARPDLVEIFDEYRRLLHANGIGAVKKLVYAYASFSSGERISHLARRMYAANEEAFQGEGLFETGGEVYRWCKKNGFLGKADQSGMYSSMNYKQNDPRIAFINTGLRFLLKILGANRYTMLMKYLSFVTVLRNQKDVFKA